LAAIKVLDEQPRPRSRIEADGTVTTWRSMLLREADLHQLFLFRVSMRDADLQFANLHGAWLWPADLSGVDLRGADLRRSTMSHADLRGAQLADTRFQNANLANVKLSDGVHINADEEPETMGCDYRLRSNLVAAGRQSMPTAIVKRARVRRRHLARPIAYWGRTDALGSASVAPTMSLAN
jgi:hypothetical protein